MTPSSWVLLSFVLSCLQRSLARRVLGMKEESKNDTASASNGKGVVDELYMFGAPGPFEFAPTNECFPGRRIINRWGRNEWWAPSTIDAVPALTTLVGLRHYRMNMGSVDLRYENYTFDTCPQNSSRDPSGTPSIPIHMPSRYDEAASILPAREGMMAGFSRTAYQDDIGVINSRLQNTGFKLVGKALSVTDWHQISLLLQSSSSLECVITFQGTESTADWVTNFRASWTEFCGLAPHVHFGFRKQLMRMIENDEFQRNILAKLPHCSKLTAVGHSMGGAVAALMAACLQKAPSNNRHYEAMRFQKGEPKNLPEFHR